MVVGYRAFGSEVLIAARIIALQSEGTLIEFGSGNRRIVANAEVVSNPPQWIQDEWEAMRNERKGTVLKKGMLVNIYQDPFTCELLEGRANLVKKHDEDHLYENWEVVFPEDEDETMTVFRSIKKR